MLVKPEGGAIFCAKKLESFLNRTHNGKGAIGLAFRFTGWDSNPVPPTFNQSANIKVFTIYEDSTGYYFLKNEIHIHYDGVQFSTPRSSAKLEDLQYHHNDLLIPGQYQFCFCLMYKNSIEQVIQECREAARNKAIVDGKPEEDIEKIVQNIKLILRGINYPTQSSESFNFAISCEDLVYVNTGIPCPPIWTGVPVQRTKLVTTHAVFKASNPKSSNEAILKSLSRHMTEETRNFYEKNWDEIIPKLKALYEQSTDNICTV